MEPAKLFDRTTNLIEANLERRTTSNSLIARNLANVDTPNFHGTGLEFEKQLRAALEGGVLPAAVNRTHPKHLPYETEKPFGQAKGEYKDTGYVHLDIEMSKLAENNIMFNAMIQLLNKKYTILKNAITESPGGR